MLQFSNRCYLWLVFLIALTAHAVAQGNKCFVTKLINQHVEIGVAKGDVKVSAIVNAKITCNGPCYFMDKANLFIVRNKRIGVPLTDSVFRVVSATQTERREIVAKTIESVKQKGSDCVGDFVRTKVETNDYLVCKSSSGEQTLLVLPKTEDDIAKFGLVETGPFYYGIALVKSINKYYFIRSDYSYLQTDNQGEGIEFDFASDFSGGVAVVGKDVAPGVRQYFFLNQRGSIVSTDTFSNCAVTDDFFYFEASNGKKVAYSRGGRLASGNIDSLVAMSDMRGFGEGKGRGILQDFLYEKKTAAQGTRTLLAKSRLGHSYLISPDQHKVKASLKEFKVNASDDNIYVAYTGDFIIIITKKKGLMSEDYATLSRIDGTNLYQVKTKAGKWNIIDENLHKKLHCDFRQISVVDGNVVCVGGDLEQCERFELKGEQLSFKNRYDVLTQFTAIKVGFWANKVDGSYVGGFYTKDKIDTLSQFGCRRIDGKTILESANRFSGFNPDNIAIISGDHIGAAVISSSKEVLIPFDCNPDRTAELRRFEEPWGCSLVSFKGPIAESNFSVIVRKGRLLSEGFRAIEPLHGTSLFQITKGNGPEFGLVDNNGRLAVDCRYYGFNVLQSDSLIKVDSVVVGNPWSHRFGFLNLAGKWLVPCSFVDLEISRFGFFIGHTASGSLDIMDSRGQKLSGFLPYKYAEVLFQKVLKVSTDGKHYGVCSFSGKLFLEPVFQHVIFENGILKCCYEGKWFDLTTKSSDGSPLAVYGCISGECEVYRDLQIKRAQREAN